MVSFDYGDGASVKGKRGDAAHDEVVPAHGGGGPPQGRESEIMETGVVSNKEAAPDWRVKRPKKEKERRGVEEGMR